MYHSQPESLGRKVMTSSNDSEDIRQVGRSGECDLALDDLSVSGIHARVKITPEGFISIRDLESGQGTHLHRNGHWVRIRKIILGAGDRIRFGTVEVSLDRLLALFGERTRVRLRQDELARSREVFARPRRNPVTGKIEEQAN